MTPRRQLLKERIASWTSLKVKISAFINALSREWKEKTEWEKIRSKDVSDKVLLLKNREITLKTQKLRKQLIKICQRL